MENELHRKKKAMESAQEDINSANSRIGELTQQINNLLASNNDLLVCLQLIYLLIFMNINEVIIFYY